MKIRVSFAVAFAVLCALSAYLGFADIHFGHDKALHLVTFFALSLVFYWAIDTSRKRSINLSVIVCMGVLGVGSEFAQNFSPYRQFDPIDIVYNLVGSGLAIALSAWYHKRLLSRKRSARYDALHQTSTPHQEYGQAEAIDLESQTPIPASSGSKSFSPTPDSSSSSNEALNEVAPEPAKVAKD